MRIRLQGLGGEPVDFLRCLLSHGVADLPPFSVDRQRQSLTVTLVCAGTVRTVRITSPEPGWATARVLGRPVTPLQRAALRRQIVHVLRLEEDLSAFYAMAADDPALAWAAAGAGRLIRGQTVFEDVVKTICTTNCAWSATERMVGALVTHLGRRAPDAPPDAAAGRAFPTPLALADADERFYRDVARTGYRGAYIRRLARSVADGEIDPERLNPTPAGGLSDDEVEAHLLKLPGVGPYAAAHIMMMLGRYSRLVLDSWTRPTYARLAGRTKVSDAALRKRFLPYGPYAGLAFWLLLTRDWVE